MQRLCWLLRRTGMGLCFLAAAGLMLSAAQADPPEKPPTDGKLRIISFGAHPDDAELISGGVAAVWAQAGDHVKLVSVTNGDTGHWRISGGALAKRRTAEAAEAAKVLGVASEVLDIHNSELDAGVENRKRIARLIRDWNADVVIGHRPYDYHPDHRYVGVLLQDTAFIVTVPFYCPDTPALKNNPVYLYSPDRSQRPVPFRADVVASIDSVIERKLDAVMKMESQFVEGGAGGSEESMPKTDAEWAARRKQSRERFRQRFADVADRYRDKLIEFYGPEDGRKVRYAEAFEISEYGRQPTNEELRELFPSLPKNK